MSSPGLAVRLFLAAGLMLAAAGGALAVQPDERLQDPALEARARALSTNLRCMVCQNQSIDDSDAQLARDLRLLVRERIAAGDSDEAVIDFLVERYGQYVLLKPRFEPETVILWLSAPALLIAGSLGAYVAWRRRRAAGPGPAEAALSPEEEAALKAALDRGEKGASP